MYVIVQAAGRNRKITIGWDVKDNVGIPPSNWMDLVQHEVILQQGQEKAGIPSVLTKY